MANLMVLFEHASGYGLFKVVEFEEVAMFLPQVEDAVADFNKFRSLVSLVAFSPFKTAVNALENINAISEGLVHEDLQVFLETNVPKKSKKKGVVLGVADSKLGATISETLDISCSHIGAVPEILRGIRLFFHRLVSGLTLQNASKAQLGLGHSYSRSKVKFNVNRVDNMIIQSIALLDQLDKDINIFAMRIREWYSYHFPELIKLVPDNHMYARCARIIKDRKTLAKNEEVITELGMCLQDEELTDAIVQASKSSMGMNISPIDLVNIEMFADRVVSLSEYRARLNQYLKEKMGGIAPNLTQLMGEAIGARLISKAGSLINLAKCPSSTIQILGAEKALFRALKTRSNTPKYGLIFHSSFIGRADKKDKGRIARFLSNKCSIASRVDCFNEDDNTVFGEMLREQVEERLRFFETGSVPRKNVDVMTEAEEARQKSRMERAARKKAKKAAKRQSKLEAAPPPTQKQEEQEEVGTPVDKKKKKKNKKGNQEEQQMEQEEVVTPVDNKKKKRKHSEMADEDGENGLNMTNGSTEHEKSMNGDGAGGKKQKKNKKKKSMVSV